MRFGGGYRVAKGGYMPVVGIGVDLEPRSGGVCGRFRAARVVLGFGEAAEFLVRLYRLVGAELFGEQFALRLEPKTLVTYPRGVLAGGLDRTEPVLGFGEPCAEGGDGARSVVAAFVLL
ncbi:MAG: hypothetical protein J6P71_03985 [Oscillospiraceae bacterium]|nr:hypothetical protein [Oscillospiraceae bacterium]